jgi:hypothetical protein
MPTPIGIKDSQINNFMRPIIVGLTSQQRRHEILFLAKHLKIFNIEPNMTPQQWFEKEKKSLAYKAKNLKNYEKNKGENNDRRRRKKKHRKNHQQKNLFPPISATPERPD